MEEFFDLFADSYIRELAFQACVNLTANAISKCELRTYRDGREIREAEHYLWNYSPNQNQNSSAFWHKLVHNLYRDNKALVVEQGGKLYVADSWARKEYALYDDLFSQVTVGDYGFSKTFAMSEVLFFQLAAENARQVDMIDLSHELVRTLLFLYRGGGFDAKLKVEGQEPVVG